MLSPSEVSEMRGGRRRGGSAIELLLSKGRVPPAAPLHEIGLTADDEVAHCRHVRSGQSTRGDLVTNSEIVDREAGEGEVSRASSDTHSAIADLANLIAELREQWRRRQSWHRAEKALTLQAKALCRRLAEGGCKKEADVIYRAALGKGQHSMAEVALAAMMPLTEARDGIAKHRAAVEKRLVKLAAELPVAPFVEATRGVGPLSLAAIVGEAGDLSNYANPGKLWKRMGLAVMPDGRQRRTSGVAALEHGYSPARRSVMWDLGACIVKAGGPLKAVYDSRKLYELERPETLSRAHAHNKAQRYTEKRFLKLLWSEWDRGGDDRTACGTHTSRVGPATLS